MNKTVTVNLGGIVFHIDEEAYDMLRNYLDTIKRHFGTSNGAMEIMSDIESRFGEMFTEKLTGGRQVVLKSDVEECITIMGKPEDIADGMNDNETQSRSHETEFTNTTGKKRFYRNPDDKVIGGVCGGIATYFGFDPIWLRLAFAISIFGFGTGFLFYILLMIIIPKARTTAEKLEMRGEPVNISNIEKSIKEEFNNIKSNFNEFTSEAKETGKKNVKPGIEKFISDLGEFISQVIGFLFKTVGKLISVIFILIAFIVLFVLGTSLLGSMGIIDDHTVFHYSINGNDYSGLSGVTGLIFTSDRQLHLTLFAICLLIGIPFLRLLISGISYLFKIKTNYKALNIIFGIVWALGLCLAVLQAIDIAQNFSKESQVKESIAILQPQNQTLFIDVSDDSELENDTNEFAIPVHHVSLRIAKSETDSFELIKVASARGKTMGEAIELAKNTPFSIQQFDSLLTINPVLYLHPNDKFRNQRVNLILKVPVGKQVYFSNQLEHTLKRARNENGTPIEKMLGHQWKMGKNKLECVDCE